MKTRKIIVEVICLLLMLNFFYEGGYKIIHINQYEDRMRYLPFLGSIGVSISYIVPTVELALALLLVFPKYRIFALYSIITVLMLFVLYVMIAIFFSDKLYFPYHALWKDPNWLQKSLYSISLSWLALIAIIFSGSKTGFGSYFLRALKRADYNIRKMES